MSKNVIVCLIIFCLWMTFLPTESLATDSTIEQNKYEIRLRDKEILKLEKKRELEKQFLYKLLAKMEEIKDKFYPDNELERKISEQERILHGIYGSTVQLEIENEDARKKLDEVIVAAVTKVRSREMELNRGGNHLTYTGEGKLYWPVDYAPLTSLYGRRFDPVKREYLLHKGVDLGADMGTPIHAAADGEVIEARPSNGYGYIVVIYHGSGLSTLYAHMYAQTVTVSIGDQVKRGELIAAVGSNGWSTGPHLHFEVHRDGEAIDPLPFLR